MESAKKCVSTQATSTHHSGCSSSPSHDRCPVQCSRELVPRANAGNTSSPGCTGNRRRTLRCRHSSSWLWGRSYRTAALCLRNFAGASRHTHTHTHTHIQNDETEKGFSKFKLPTSAYVTGHSSSPSEDRRPCPYSRELVLRVRAGNTQDPARTDCPRRTRRCRLSGFWLCYRSRRTA